MSLVGGTRGRRPSLDIATVMQTPVHPISFAEQQEQQDTEISFRGSPKMDTATLPSQVVPSALRREDLPQDRHAGKDKNPPFDFQKLLDQMKTKSAEPVARYLRSYVP